MQRELKSMKEILEEFPESYFGEDGGLYVKYCNNHLFYWLSPNSFRYLGKPDPGTFVWDECILKDRPGSPELPELPDPPGFPKSRIDRHEEFLENMIDALHQSIETIIPILDDIRTNTQEN